MFERHVVAVSLPLILSLTAGCRPPGDGAAECGSLEPRNENEVELCNELDQGIIARIELPAGSPPAGGWPGVVLLHGSGGLFESDDGVCTQTVQQQFESWAKLLNARGYAVLMPASFYSRGFCEWHDKSAVPRQIDKEERLVVRTFDAAAAGNWLCDDPRFDCARLALLGFSNGASTALMLMHEDLDDAEDPRLQALDDVPAFVGGAAYYPGCGLQGELATELSLEDVDRYYYPKAPVWVPHGSKDGLADTCEELRDPQVDVISDLRGVNTDMFEIQVYAGADHGFDGSDDDDSAADLAARQDAEARTLARLDAWLN